MTSKQESYYHQLLLAMPKDNIIDLFIKLKKINETYCARIDKLEAQIDELITLDKLLEDLSWHE